jgi:hypothetical protein
MNPVAAQFDRRSVCFGLAEERYEMEIPKQDLIA